VGASVDKEIFDEASIWNYLNLVIENLSKTTKGDGLDCFDEQTIRHDVDGHPEKSWRSQTVCAKSGHLDLSGVQPSMEKLKAFRQVVRRVDVIAVPFFVATSEGFAKER
jgi:hypothetical protein